ncbi:prepilin peptidase CpaA [Fulvimarina manganoxydans]|uniref:Prepilin peptidase CpaA n=1 Tax=Fulvimarina manganoxydans TaxID=937218 RepID=A0A1W1ZAE8_9HYPH|nr:prepilin peptidase [Fulvimarina manganoxydans]MEE2950423.1 prepilin peptidase [Pseudomonadota bacterium]SMC45191.1 prepilin peptidase CpaA [Fulvimarina manganoxydans]
MILSQAYTYALLMAFPACLILAGLSDFMTMTISNRLCAAIAILFPFAALQFGLPLSDFAAHMGVGFAVFVLGFALFSLNLIGGGDAKLLAASALWIGPDGILAYGVLVALFGGALAIVLLSARSLLAPVTGFAAADRLLEKETGVPYGIAIAAAGFVVYSDGPLLTAALAWL